MPMRVGAGARARCSSSTRRVRPPTSSFGAVRRGDSALRCLARAQADQLGEERVALEHPAVVVDHRPGVQQALAEVLVGLEQVEGHRR